GAVAQPPVPQPFPRPAEPGQPAPAKPSEPAPPPAPARPAQPAPSGAAPTSETLGLPVYPGAEFLASYDAGRGQRYYLFGTNASYVEIVAYYRSYLRQRGSQVFEQPPVHAFDVGRFREQTMAFPPGITVKDYTWGGSEGYLHVRPDGRGVRYRTIIQVVPPPPGQAGREKP
ncbi:MAG TPA: hypothetical protein VNI83_16335, partial [Vicinamibacterales bacterium]|nr:hypothetical protein [Vicinamibacterales bacterium]